MLDNCASGLRDIQRKLPFMVGFRHPA
jgi:hypothetical protein